MKCDHCGAELLSGKTMCPSCGRPVQKSMETLKQKESGQTVGFVIAGILCAGVAFFFLPPLFGGIGMYLGIQAHKKNHPMATLVIVLSAIGFVVGMALGFMNAL